MKPAELRIGNFINTEDGQAEVRTMALSVVNAGVGLGSVFSGELKADVVKYEKCYPINLTVDWLHRFGFFEEDDEWFKGNVRLGKVDQSYYFSGLKDEIVGIDYVHQLQNLAYVLNGEDLVLEY